MIGYIAFDYRNFIFYANLYVIYHIYLYIYFIKPYIYVAVKISGRCMQCFHSNKFIIYIIKKEYVLF